MTLMHNMHKVSTSIGDFLTFGSGELDANGFWEHPCYECARAHEKEYPEDFPCWPFSEEYIEDLKRNKKWPFNDDENIIRNYVVLESIEYGNRFFSTYKEGEDATKLLTGETVYKVIGYAETIEQAQKLLGPDFLQRAERAELLHMYKEIGRILNEPKKRSY